MDDFIIQTEPFRAVCDLCGLHLEQLLIHQKNVSRLCDHLASAIGLDEHSSEILKIASLVHDAGMIAIPREILELPRSLMEDEFDLVKSHSAIGATIFAQYDSMNAVCPIIEQHHERFDGAGYPHGLKRDDIVIEARILAVVETYDLLRSWSPYQAQLNHSEAMDELRASAGSQHDPRIVEAFFQMEAEVSADPTLTWNQAATGLPE